MIVLGVDPGSHVTGYGVVEEGAGGKLRALAWGAIRAPRQAPVAERLKKIAGGLRAVISAHDPDTLAIEESFFAANPRTALILGMARGAVMLVGAEAGLAMREYAALLVKKTVAGYGHAGKDQLGLMVRHILALKETPAPHDASDALAIAVTCLTLTRAERRMAR